MSDYVIDTILNEDGTPYDPPKNPLWDKWINKYPPTPMPQYSQVCDGYSCMYCGRCPKGDYWKVPAEDQEEYDQWQFEFEMYMILHNPRLSCGIDIQWAPEQYALIEKEKEK